MKIFFVPLLFFIMAGVAPLHAQQLFFCSGYSATGVPKDTLNRFEPGKGNNYIYILYKNKNNPIKSRSLTVVIQKWQDNMLFQPYERKKMMVEDKKSWAILDYPFTENGDYKVSILDKKGKELASSKIQIFTKLDFDPPVSAEYDRARLVFCRFARSNVPVDSGDVFSTGQVMALLSNIRSLATDTIIVDISKKAFQSEKYSIYVATRYEAVDSAAGRAAFYLEFDQTGQYKIELYNKQNQKMAVGYITVR